MDDLPPSLLLEILNRLSDSADLARCRVASKTLNDLSREVKSVNLFCSSSRYFKYRSVQTEPQLTPFKLILKKLIFNSMVLDSVAIGVEKSLGGLSFEYDGEEDEEDDLYLTDVGFAREWLVGIAGDLMALSISDFWIQSCWRQSKILALITSCCNNLLKLELKNAWLSVDDLKRMTSLKSLTLEFIRLDDEDLSKVNYSFPHLEVLNLIGVGGLYEPKIHLLHLKTCQWTVSNAPVSLRILAPNLLKLKLKCVKPKSLIVETRMLSDFQLSLEDAGGLQIKELPYLGKLQLHSPSNFSLIEMFASAKTIKELKLETQQCAEPVKFCLDTLFDIFPNLNFLKLGRGTWSEAETCFRAGGLEGRIGMNDLRKIHANKRTYKIEFKLPFILSILDKCTNVFDTTWLIYRDVDSSCFADDTMSSCVNNHPRVRWRWELLEEGIREACVNDI